MLFDENEQIVKKHALSGVIVSSVRKRDDLCVDRLYRAAPVSLFRVYYSQVLFPNMPGGQTVSPDTAACLKAMP